MTDLLPFPSGPLEPDPAFAAILRARLSRALSRPAPGASVRTLTPYLAVPDARAAIEWYVDVLGAVEDGQRYEEPDGRIGHAELVLGGQRLMLSDEFPELGLAGPRESVSVTLHLGVDDVDAVVAAATAAGAVLERAAADAPYGRNAVVRDPSGHRWMLMTTPAEPLVPRHGEVGYVTMGVADAETAKAFYGDVLGWAFSPGSVPDGWQVEDRDLSVGLWGGGRGGETSLTFRVDDLAAAVDRVRAAGGQADEPDDKPYGRLAECRDDQGVGFSLWQP